MINHGISRNTVRRVVAAALFVGAGLCVTSAHATPRLLVTNQILTPQNSITPVHYAGNRRYYRDSYRHSGRRNRGNFNFGLRIPGLNLYLGDRRSRSRYYDNGYNNYYGGYNNYYGGRNYYYGGRNRYWDDNFFN